MLTYCVLIGISAFGAPAEAADVKHVKVYYEAERFGGWPANHGIWSWGNEILVGFSRGYYKDLGPARHNIDRDKPEEHCLARSLDGGETWTVEHPNEKGYLIPQGESLHGTETQGLKIPEWKECPGGIDFLNPGFAMTLRMTSVDAAPARFSYSYDRGKTWEGPFRLPDFDTPGIAARTDYIVSGHDDCLFFLTAAKSDGKEGRPLCVQTKDGGKTFEFVSWIAPEIKGAGFEIMPASARLSDTDILVITRHHEGKRKWLSSYITHDDGRTWTHLNDPVDNTGEGNPPTLTLLKDGRLCLIYGYRAEPFSMRAKLSKDGGNTWSDEIVLRADGITRDIGYPRTVQRTDGKIVTVYYWCNEETKPDRYIAATIWDPGK